MKKQNLLKLAFTMLAMVVITGAMAQTYPTTIETNYVEATVNTLQTTGYGLTLYVAPDPAFSPGYTGTGTTGINPTSVWTWTVGGTAQTATTDNYVSIPSTSLPAAGSTLVVEVAESITGITCAGTTRTHTITVVDVPSADISAAPAGDWDELTAGSEWQTCTSGLSENISIAFTEAGVAAGTYAYALDVAVTNVDGGGAETTGTPIERVVPINGTLVSSPATQSIQFDLTTGFSRTKYVVSLRTGSIGSAISRVSQFRAGVTPYDYSDPANTTLTFWVNKPPVTGPIYHIPNDYAF
ncbi:MAG: hypothetical protein RBR40_11355 [Tenuifilaceae bacterium]|nr:hypothetical protein [Tenuifilaceae bacterium]